jgi:hypothetical protein
MAANESPPSQRPFVQATFFYARLRGTVRNGRQAPRMGLRSDLHLDLEQAH